MRHSHIIKERLLTNLPEMWLLLLLARMELQEKKLVVVLKPAERRACTVEMTIETTLMVDTDGWQEVRQALLEDEKVELEP